MNDDRIPRLKKSFGRRLSLLTDETFLDLRRGLGHNRGSWVRGLAIFA
jgi:hypothetical protein